MLEAPTQAKMEVAPLVGEAEGAERDADWLPAVAVDPDPPAVEDTPGVADGAAVDACANKAVEAKVWQLDVAGTRGVYGTALICASLEGRGHSVVLPSLPGYRPKRS